MVKRNGERSVNMPLAHIWTGRVLQPAALAVLEGLATVSVSVAGERNDWYAEASKADAILVGGETFVTGEVMNRIGPNMPSRCSSTCASRSRSVNVSCARDTPIRRYRI